MLEPGGDADLTLESLGPECRGEVWVQNFESDGPVVSEILGEVNRGHAPAPEFLHEHVTVTQGIGQRRVDCGQENAGGDAWNVSRAAGDC